jgi:hypothetical protein
MRVDLRRKYVEGGASEFISKIRSRLKNRRRSGLANSFEVR